MLTSGGYTAREGGGGRGHREGGWWGHRDGKVGWVGGVTGREVGGVTGMGRWVERVGSQGSGRWVGEVGGVTGWEVMVEGTDECSLCGSTVECDLLSMSK